MSNCLDCPDEQNYAAIALQLQETALQAEACLYEVETLLRQVTNPPTVLFTVTGIEPVSANVFQRIGEAAGTTVFANSPRINMSTVSVDWTAGVWEVGVCVTAVSSGATTVDSIRELSIGVLPSNAPTSPSIPTAAFSSITTTEPNDGVGVDMTHSTVVIVEEGEEVAFFFRHTNASIVNIQAGALYWATRLSDSTALRVV